MTLVAARLGRCPSCVTLERLAFSLTQGARFVTVKNDGKPHGCCQPLFFVHAPGPLGGQYLVICAPSVQIGG